MSCVFLVYSSRKLLSVAAHRNSAEHRHSLGRDRVLNRGRSGEQPDAVRGRRASGRVQEHGRRRQLDDPKSPAVLLASTSNGLLRSGNAGASWAQVLGRAASLAFDPFTAGTIYACGPNLPGIVESHDDGQTWATLPDVPVPWATAIAPDPLHPGTLYASTLNSPSNPAAMGSAITILATGVGQIAAVGPYAVTNLPVSI